MTLRLFDSATRELRDFTPRVPGEVGLYVCGATPQSPPHIGHLRTFVAFDVLVRWLRRTGHKVTYVRNVTDIDDKILAKAAEHGEPWWAWAMHHERLFTEAFDAVGNERPTYEPRATGHVPDMVALMQRLVERGHAYVTTPGNVYFDVRSYPEYGALTNQRVEDLPPAHDSLVPDDDAAVAKRDPKDFALWKASKPDEPATASWDTPFGPGRPGWHLECSAMATRYLGPEFDIHGGGLDLRFPHHENEQAQSRAAGDAFARFWLHSAWVTQGGEKMSKSLGNSLLVSQILDRMPGAALRLGLVLVHYRSMIEWDESTERDAVATWERFAGFVARASEVLERSGTRVTSAEVADAELPEGFVAAMDDDLNIAEALVVIHEALRTGNTALAEGDLVTLRTALLDLRAMLDVLGLDPAGEVWGAVVGGTRHAEVLDRLVAAELEARAAARAAKDFRTADAIRDRLAAAGIVVEDGPAGARWSLAEGEG